MITIAHIQYSVEKYFGLEPGSIQTKTRGTEVKEARQIAHYLARNLTNHTYSEIGKYLGNKDHSTSIHSYKIVKNFIETEKQFKININAIERLILLPQTQIDANKQKVISLIKDIYGEDSNQLRMIESIFCCD